MSDPDPSRAEAEPEPGEEEGAPPTVEYKVVETSDVTAEELERLPNETTKEGWDFDAMQFAMRESLRRASMASWFSRERTKRPDGSRHRAAVSRLNC